VGLAVTPHDVDELHAMLIGHGTEVPNSSGVFGGLEGACNEAWLLRGGSAPGHGAEAIFGPEAIRERGVQLGPKPGFFDLAAGDVFAYSFQGGGGFGDPLDRDPAAVLRDVGGGLVSADAAERLYGTVIVAGEVNLPATAEVRADHRALRISRVAEEPSTAISGVPFGGALRLDAGRWRCRCGTDLGPSAGSFKEHTKRRTVGGPAHGAITLHRDLELREHCCPRCGTLLESEVAIVGSPDLHTIELQT
jgi:N-methylhydantoinase B